MENANRVDNVQELLKTCTNLEAELQELTEMTKRRLRDFRDPSEHDDLQAAVAMLKTTTPVMIASSKAFIRYPELESLQMNRQYAYDEMRKALDCFKTVIQGETVQGPSEELTISHQGRISELVMNLEKFQVILIKK